MSYVVLYSALSLTTMGAAFGVLLALAAKKFAVARDERVERIQAILPGANCGGCGYVGCEGFARALVAGKVDAGLCSPMGGEAALRMAEILGREVTEKTRQVAFVGCEGGSRVRPRVDYRGVRSCAALVLLTENLRECRYGCIGLGTCVEACHFDAIAMVDGCAVVDDSRCTGCGACVKACPKRIISLVPRPKKVRVACSSHYVSKDVKAVCGVGCIACAICVKSCPVECIEIRADLAALDHEKCINCGICAALCPTGTIVDRVAARPKTFIGTSCSGCGECVKVCRLKAIEGKIGSKHAVILEKCIGCGLCIDVCGEKAITMVGALGHQRDE